MGDYYDMYKAYKEQQRMYGKFERAYGFKFGMVDSHGDVIMDGAFDLNIPRYYTDSPGKVFPTLNLDTFKKQEHHFWRHGIETKHDRFLRIFGVQDAVYLP